MDKSMKIAIILSAVDKASRVVNSAVGKIQGGLNKFSNFAGIAGIAGTLFFGSTIKAAEDSVVASARLSQVFKSMGQDYRKATEESANYASALQMQIGFEDETIMAVQAKLATFEKASNASARSNEVYNRATMAAFDMQAAGFGEASNNAVQLGKALQDPITGINSLRRSGITFTDAEKKKIAALVKANKTFEAQNIVMKAIEKQVGGVAKSTVTQSEKMRLAWGEVQEKIGGALLPLFTKFSNYMLVRVVPAVQKFVDEHPVLIKWLGIASVALLALSAAAKVVSFGMSGITGVFNILIPVLKFAGKTFMWLGRIMLANPILIIIAAVAAGAYLVIKHWSKIKAFFTRLWSGVKSVFRTAWNVILDIMLTPVRNVMMAWQSLTGFFSNVWSGIKGFATSTWNAIGDAITAPIVWIKEKWQALTDWITNTWGKVKGFFKGIWNGVKEGVTNAFVMPAKAIVTVQNKLSGATQKALQGGIMDNLPQSPAKKGPLKNLNKVKIMETLSTAINPKPLLGAMNNTLNRAFNSSGSVPVPVAARAGGGSMQVNFNPTYNINGGNQADIMSMFKTRERDLLKVIEEAQRKRDRTKF